MKVVVGSKNPVKIKAVEAAFKKVWPNKKWEIVGVDVPSGVSSQPMSDVESIKGATNRAKGALKNSKADFGVGIEGGMKEIGNTWFTSGWVVVVDNKGQKGIGSSINMKVPNKIINLIKKGKELGEVSDKFFKVKNSKQKLGYFGHMSDGKLPRASAYVQGTISALAVFLNPKIFDE